MDDQPQISISTVQIRVTTKEKLRRLAELNRRSMAGHLDWMINRDFEVEVQPTLEPEETQAA
jgi:hypothetical protein